MTFHKRLLATSLAIPLLFGVAACSQEASWHPVTTEESQLLASTRFHNFDAGTRQFSSHVTVDGGELHIDGWYDFVSHGGYALLTEKDNTDEPLTLMWTDGVVAVRQQDNTDAVGSLPAWPIPEPTDAGWTARTLDPSQSAFDALLLSFGLLGNDRPDNPLLLQQSGALWLGTETLETDDGSVEAQMFAGPPGDEPLTESDEAPTPEAATVRYALTDSGILLRVDLFLGGDWSPIHFSTTPAESIADEILWLRETLMEGAETDETSTE